MRWNVLKFQQAFKKNICWRMTFQRLKYTCDYTVQEELKLTSQNHTYINTCIAYMYSTEIIAKYMHMIVYVYI